MGGLCASSVCSLAQVAGCWARICLDGLQSDTLSGIATVSRLSLQESETEFYPQLPSSEMFVSSYSPVQLTGTEDLSMWLQAAFPVNRFQSQVVSSELTTRETCGSQQSSAFASYDQDSHSWKTCQGWLLADISAPSFQTFARAGMTVGGEYYPQPKWERRTNEIDCGLHVPTPRSSEAGDYQYSRGDHSKPTPTLSGFVKSFPTPTTDDASNVSRKSGAFQSLTRTVMYPTPTVNDSKNATLPPSQIAHDNLPGYLLRDGELPGGKLNPMWVEWLMGWVPGWTSLEPNLIDEFHRWENEQNWNDELGIPRVAEGIAGRTQRIQAIGNGQVPQCMAMAWKLLMEER